MKRGSVMAYSGKIYHGSGENKSDKVRKAVNINYAVGWLRQEENQFLSCPEDVARTLSEPLLQAMGYRCTAALGYVTDRLDPLGAALPKYRDADAVHPTLGDSALEIMTTSPATKPA